MPQFIKLAEDVYSHIIKEHSFKGELIQDLFEIQIALKTLIKDTEYELKHDWINFEDVVLHSKVYTNLKIDLSLVPKHTDYSEYILWMASMIESMTINGQRRMKPIYASMHCIYSSNLHD
ncbi:hypothetical protein [Acinetobacter soli]|uniref:hypothetical protein n=1 Tax=Acinetobacter soli TaxID=487316 RepID=UPI0027DBC28D